MRYISRNLSVILTSLLVFVFILLTAIMAHGKLKSTGAHPGTTGAPGEATCSQAGCHVDASVQDGAGINSLLFGSKRTTSVAYQADSVYDVIIHIEDPTAKRFGFEIVALDSSLRNVGTLAVPVSIKQPRVQVIQNDGKLYCTHVAGSIAPTEPGKDEWMVNWHAPTSYFGPVTFYYATNSANGNNNALGDKVYLSSTTINSALTSDVQLDNPLEMGLDCSFDNGRLNMQFPAASAFKVVQCRIVSVDGKSVYSHSVECDGSGSASLSVSPQLAEGVYIVLATTDSGIWRQRFIISH